jgi:hypothetical protein
MALADRIETERDNPQPANRNHAMTADAIERTAQRLQSLTETHSRYAHIIANATDIIHAAEALGPGPAPDPATPDPRTAPTPSTEPPPSNTERGISLGR